MFVNYHKLNKLKMKGEGSYGMIYKALDKRDDEVIALKIAPKDNVSSNELIKQINLFKSCSDSDYLIKCRDSFIKDDNIWIAMEYCAGGSILDIIRITKQNLSEQYIQIIMRETLKGLKYLHDKNIVHRDIKAGNILINHHGACKLGMYCMYIIPTNYIIIWYIYS